MNNLFSDEEIEKLRQICRHSLRNRTEIMRSERCGCFHCCLESFSPASIDEWWDEREEDGLAETAVCPHCGIDSVIGDASGNTITPELLQRLMDFRF